MSGIINLLAGLFKQVHQCLFSCLSKRTLLDEISQVISYLFFLSSSISSFTLANTLLNISLIVFSESSLCFLSLSTNCFRLFTSSWNFFVKTASASACSFASVLIPSLSFGKSDYQYEFSL